jgi:branched-chain amino acid transport system permease protein
MVIFGGMGNLAGSVVGAGVLVLLQPVLERLVDLSPEQASLTRLVIYGAGLALLMRLRPQGALPEATSLADLVLGRRRLGRAPGPADGHVPLVAPAALARPDGKAPPEVVTAALEAAPAVQVRGLSRRFGGIVAVDDLDLELLPGLVTALVGPNGAGKTTVFNLLTGVVRPDRGTALLNGRDVTGKRLDQVTRLGMARSFQDVRVHARLSALENVMLGVQDQPGEHLASLFLAPRSVRQHARATRDLAMDCLRSSGWRTWPPRRPAPSPSASRSWSRSRGCSRRGQMCSCSTSRPPGSTSAGSTPCSSWWPRSGPRGRRCAS